MHIELAPPVPVGRWRVRLLRRRWRRQALLRRQALHRGLPVRLRTMLLLLLDRVRRLRLE